MHNGPSHAMFGGAGVSLVAGLTLNEVAAVVGIIVAVAGLLLNGWHKWKIRQMERERLEFEMRRSSSASTE
ncbi:MAG: holin [Pseudomonadota bacterium]